MNKVPKPFTTGVSEQTSLAKTIDNFFIETKEFVEQKYNTRSSDFEIRSGELAYNSIQITDNRVTYLQYKEFILASVFATRTDFNNVRYTFFRNLDGFETWFTNSQT